MDDQEIKGLEDRRLAVLAGMEGPLRAERDAARAAFQKDQEAAAPCERCKHKTTPRAKGLKLAWGALTNAWGVAERALREVVHRIDPEKKRQKAELDAVRRRKAELELARTDARAVATSAKKALVEAEEDAAGDKTLVAETKGTLDDAAARLKEIDQELGQLAKREVKAEKLLEKAIAEFVQTNRPTGKALDAIEQELRAAILPKPKAGPASQV